MAGIDAAGDGGRHTQAAFVDGRVNSLGGYMFFDVVEPQLSNNVALAG